MYRSQGRGESRTRKFGRMRIFCCSIFGDQRGDLTRQASKIIEKEQSKDPHGGVAQLGEHLPCKQGVMGSIPIISTIFSKQRRKAPLIWKYREDRVSRIRAENLFSADSQADSIRNLWAVETPLANLGSDSHHLDEKNGLMERTRKARWGTVCSSGG